MQETIDVKVGAFTYKIRINLADDGAKFDIFDNVIVKGEVMSEIVGSGRVDAYGRCKLEIYCDVHAAMALGDIMKDVYEKSAEMMLEEE